MITEFQCSNCSEFISISSTKKGHDITCPDCTHEQPVPLQGSIEVGNIIEDHLVQEEIGHGAMGKVFLASHLLMSRQVALKTISPKIRQDSDAVQQFIQELQMGAQLSHPNIVTVYTAGYSDGVYYISMQFIDGFDMNERVEQSGPLAEKEALAVASRIADAMSYAWNDYNMIHRDLKPENVRVSNRGEVMIMDFGLAKMRTDESDNEEGLIIGTPDFMSPEQAKGQTDLDFRADIYGLGVVLVYLMTGQRPFKSDNPFDVVNMHINRPLPSIKRLHPDAVVSDETQALINKMTEKDRNSRYNSWEEVAIAVDRIISADHRKPGKKKKPATKSGGRKGSSRSTKVNMGPVTRRRRRKKSSNIGIIILFVIFLTVVLGVVLSTKL